METTKDILNELTAISPLVAGMKKVNVFSVPGGYFDSVCETVLACLREDANLVKEGGTPVSTDIPEGYFENLAASILEKIKTGTTATAEIRNLSPLLYSIQNKNVFEVPEGYFESIETNLFDGIITMNPKEELKMISPLLYSFQKETVFEVPEGYFDGLEGKILEKIQQPGAKIISIQRRNMFLKYAAAAMITGVMALGLYNYFGNKANDIKTGFTASTLDAYIEKGKNMDEKQFNEELEKLTGSDIARYLEKNGDISDVAALGNNIGESDLPSQEDYLLDESTLENYLKNIEQVTPNN